MEMDRLVGLLESVRGMRDSAFRMEQALLDALSEEGASDPSANERWSDEWFTLAELGA